MSAGSDRPRSGREQTPYPWFGEGLLDTLRGRAAPRPWALSERNPDFIDKVLQAALRSRTESEEYDFKRELDLDTNEHRYKLIKSVAAFSNSPKGGFLFIGVDDDAQVHGVPERHLGWFDRTRLSQLLASYLTPVPDLEIHKRSLPDGEVVIVRVEPFREIPTFLSRPLEVGGKKLAAGTILVRNERAESRAATEEFEIRKLCTAIAERQAESMAAAIRRALEGHLGPTAGDGKEGALGRVRKLAAKYWIGPSQPCLEVGFQPYFPIGLGHEDMRGLFPTLRLDSRRERFPCWRVPGWEGPSLRSEGWLGHLSESPEGPSRTFWALTDEGAFLQRERLLLGQEGRTPVLGLRRIALQVVLLLRLLRRFSARLGFSSRFAAYATIRVTGAEGLVLASELVREPDSLPGSGKDVVEVRKVVTIEQLEREPLQAAGSLLADFSWEFERTDLTPRDWIRAIDSVHDHLDRQGGFPANEKIRPWFEA